MKKINRNDFLYDRVTINGLEGELGITEIDYDGEYHFTLMVTVEPNTELVVRKSSFTFVDPENEALWAQFVAERETATA